MAEEKTKFISESGLISLLENLSGRISDYGSGLYGTIMGQCVKRSELYNGLEFGTNPNTEGYGGEPYLGIGADDNGITGVNIPINIDTLGQPISIGSFSADSARLTMRNAETTLFGGSSVSLSTDYQGGMDGVAPSSILLGNGIDITSGANLNISATDYSDADAGYDYGNINIDSKTTTIYVQPMNSTQDSHFGVDAKDANIFLWSHCDMTNMGDHNIYIGNPTRDIKANDNNIYLTAPGIYNKAGVYKTTVQSSIVLETNDNYSHVSIDDTNIAIVAAGGAGVLFNGDSVITDNNIYATAFYETSDENLKDFSDSISVDFDKLKEIRKSYFTWKDGDGKMQIGTSAQDVQKVYPELVSETKDSNLTVDYAKLSLVALAAVDKLEERLSRIEKALNITE